MSFLLKIDQQLFFLINSLNFKWLNSVMVFLSGQLIWLPVILFFIFLSFKQFERKKFLTFLLFLSLVIIASDVSSSYLLKNIVKRIRPCHVEDFKMMLNNVGQRCGGKYGFVSSHAANSIGLIIFSLGAIRMKKWYIFFGIIPLLIAYSRIYLGVHYPGDILGGFIIGSFWSILFLTIFRSHYGANRDISQ